MSITMYPIDDVRFAPKSGYRIYRNLHQKRWSIQGNLVGRGWRVIGHATSLTAPSATFVVSEAGRQRAQREQRKNVHAFAVVPYLRPALVDPVFGEDAEVTYTPYDNLGFRAGSFGNLDHATAPIFEADGCIYARQVFTNGVEQGAL